MGKGETGEARPGKTGHIMKTNFILSATGRV